LSSREISSFPFLACVEEYDVEDDISCSDLAKLADSQDALVRRNSISINRAQASLHVGV
jgi:hypothetical protein